MKKLALLMLLVSTPADSFTVRGVGSMSCYEWNNGQGWDAKVQYALGYVSGAESVLLPKITSGTRNIDNNSIIQAVTIWCKQNPNQDIADALIAAVHALTGY